MRMVFAAALALTLATPAFAKDITVTGKVHACAETEDAICVLTGVGEGVPIGYEAGPKESRDPQAVKNLATLSFGIREEWTFKVTGPASADGRLIPDAAAIRVERVKMPGDAPGK